MSRERGEGDVGVQGPGELLGLIAHDAERLLGQHVALLRSEFRRELVHEIPLAIGALGAGAGLAATGGLLGSLMLVHGLHRTGRLPLWACYGAVGGLMAGLGAGLITAGARRAANLSLVPYETVAVLKEDAQWIKDQMIPPKS